MVDTATITKNNPIPTIGPVATNVTAKAAGKKIPNPLIPTMFRENAITNAIKGSIRSSTIVLSGTPAAMDASIACLTGLKEKIFMEIKI